VSDNAITVDDPVAAVHEWFEKLSLYCSTVDYASARAIFADDVSSFGTKADAVTGLDRLQREQWEEIWPRTSDFRVLMDTIRAGGEGNVAWGMAAWMSAGYDRSGGQFTRRGRATVVVARREGRWVSVHTHFSLSRGIPQDTYGGSEA
jgi:ketosteroid isomerase-like protein